MDTSELDPDFDLKCIQRTYQLGLLNTNVFCALAAQQGRLNHLQWGRSQGFPWSPDVCMEAVRYGHLELLKWAVYNGCPWRKSICLRHANDAGIIAWIKSRPSSYAS